MLVAEISYLQKDFGRSLVSSDPARFTKTVADKTYYVLFEATRCAYFVRWIGAPTKPSETGLRARIHAMFQPIAAYVLTAMQVTQVFSVRLAILVLALPVLGLFSLVAIVDGLVKRDLRAAKPPSNSAFSPLITVRQHSKLRCTRRLQALWPQPGAVPYRQDIDCVSNFVSHDVRFVNYQFTSAFNPARAACVRIGG